MSAERSLTVFASIMTFGAIFAYFDISGWANVIALEFKPGFGTIAIKAIGLNFPIAFLAIRMTFAAIE